MERIAGEDAPPLSGESSSPTKALDVVSNSDAASTDILSDASSSQLSLQQRRSSRRLRKSVVAGGAVASSSSMIMDELELDALLSESTQALQASSGRRRVKGNQIVSDDNNDDSVVTDVQKWVEVELLLKLRRTAPFPESSTPQTVAEQVEQYAHFAKFRDQSYWHCGWMTGQTILGVNPGLAKNFHKRNPDLVALADEEFACKTDSTSNPASLPSSDDESAQEDNDAEDASEVRPPIVGSKWMISLVPRQPFRGRRRYFYYIENGVDPHYLYPEAVLSTGETFKPTRYTEARRRGRGKKSAVYSARFREVLVKWNSLDEGQATWETVEADLQHLDTMLPKYRDWGLFPLDLCGRRLLPAFVRRWILQLTQAHYTLVASLCSAHFGAGEKPRQLPERSDPPFNWQESWTHDQPSYLSPRMKGLESGGGILHPYQREGVRWLRHSYYRGRNTILADEMGLGKTIQVIAMLFSLLQEDNRPGPHLIVAPLSTTTNWQREFTFWAPGMQVVLYTGDRQNRAMMNEFCLRLSKFDIPAFHVLITSYEMVSLERSILSSFQWDALVVDEAHRLKNKHTRLFRDLSSSYDVKFKCLLTGTPLQNNIDELFHLLSFIDPKQFSDVKSLSSQWAELSKEERVGLMHSHLKDHLLRRMKRDVIQDLPRKTEIVVPLDLTPLQRRIYKLVLTKNYEELRTRCLTNTLLHLQKVCAHPYLMPVGMELAPRLDDGSYDPKGLVAASAKLDLVMRMLPRLRDGGHRVLIFSNLVILLNLVEIALKNAGYPYERIDGSIRGNCRQGAIDRFNAQNATPFVFLLSTRAGGEGINLASADTVFLLDSDWNPHRDLQALARAHRIGQSKHVLIYRLIMRSTVEERVLQVAQKKLALTKVVMDQGTTSAEQHSSRNQKKDKSNKKKDLLRLSHSEAHHILCAGLDALFATPDSDDDDNEFEDKGAAARENGDAKVVEGKALIEGNPKGNPTPVNVSEESLNNAETASHPDDVPRQPIGADNVVSAHKTTKTLVYDDAALERLLDRDRPADNNDVSTVAEDYLSVFKSATFATAASPNTSISAVQEAAVATEATSSSTPDDTQSTSILEEPRIAPAEVSSFWENLLRSRFEKLLAKKNRPELSRARTSALPSSSFSPSNFVDLSAIIIADSGGEDNDHNYVANYEGQDTVLHDGAAVELLGVTAGSGTLLSSTALPKREFTDHQHSQDGAWSSSDRPEHYDHHRRRKSARRPRPTALSLAADSVVRLGASTAGAEAGAMASSLAAAARRSARPRTQNRAWPTVRPQESDSETNNSNPPWRDVYGEGGDDADDEDYEASEGEWATEDDNGDEEARDTEAGRQRKPARRKQPLILEDGKLKRTAPSAENFRAAAAYRSIDWDHGADVAYALWRNVSAMMPDPDVVFGEDDTMTVFGFNAHDRQMFLEAVMRHGLPPKGIVPPPEWLPHSLQSKDPASLFAYTALFMRHLYDDPKILEEGALHWSDGLPTEGVSGASVLSRVAMMALIRSKVLEYEEFNVIPRLVSQADKKSNRFNIHEGGLTVIFHTWNQELAEVRSRLQAAVAATSSSSTSPPSEMTDTTTTQQLPSSRNFYGVISRKWHHRHDFWLLAGIHTYGYAAWADIIADDRFKIIALGLAELVLPPSECADILVQRVPDNALVNEIREKHSLNPEVFAFLSHRLRLLEQALLVEQALVQVALAVAGLEDCATADLATRQPGVVSQVTETARALSGRLAQMGPIKRVVLPKNHHNPEAVKQAIYDLHLLMEDLYADMPGLPGAVVYDGIEFAQPRFLTDPPPPHQAPSMCTPQHSQPLGRPEETAAGVSVDPLLPETPETASPSHCPVAATSQATCSPWVAKKSGAPQRLALREAHRVREIVIDLVDSD